ncbi:MAG: nucleotide exchange factor GrpE [Chitinophagaceae bacterium]|nr:nucleotide exchange factor GrpE [Chitinophagaceae bacterium]MBN8667132.1 nucleotide exchange factor GrpE [Chitinophagales bacterium]
MAEQELKDKEIPADNGPDINADENISGSTHLNDPVTDEPELEKIKAELADLRDRLLRQAAEFDNYRKRTIRERDELVQTAAKDLIADLLEVLDDSARAEGQFKEDADINQFKEGVHLIFSKLRNKLTAKGLKPMNCLHADFDADLHEAITEIPAPDDSLKGKVVDEVVKGYYLKDKILRHAKVVVGK